MNIRRRRIAKLDDEIRLSALSLHWILPEHEVQFYSLLYNFLSNYLSGRRRRGRGYWHCGWRSSGVILSALIDSSKGWNCVAIVPKFAVF
jgi:hypothetical protein